MVSHNDVEHQHGGAATEKREPMGRPVVVGEVLFDVFPEGSKVLGGAPFNVAWHLQAFGLNPILVTRVGRDAAGEFILDAMTRWGLDTSVVQIDPDAPTGEVRIAFGAGGHTFDIVADQAYDRLDGDAALRALSDRDVGLLYHGSLLARTGAGASAVAEIRTELQVPIFVDINLRDPWWTPSGVDALVRGSCWLKLNDDELARLRGHESADGNGLDAAARDFARRYSLQQLVVTRGEAGAMVCVDNRCRAGQPSRVVEAIDTVGAGDAFSAVWIAGLSMGWTVGTTLARALDFAAAVCSVRGATTSDHHLYRGHLDHWGK